MDLQAIFDQLLAAGAASLVALLTILAILLAFSFPPEKSPHVKR